MICHLKGHLKIHLFLELLGEIKNNKMINNKIYIIIVSYNGEHFITKCLKSIRENNVVCQTIVIDNASTDKTLQIIKVDFPEVRLIESQTNLGFGKANNLGLKIALKENADFVFLLNQDAFIFQDTIEYLLNAHNKHPEYNIISPIHLNGTQKELDYNFSKYISKTSYYYRASDIFQKQTGSIYSCDFINAAAWFIPIKTIKNIGLFDPIFFHYVEDDDYITRIKYHSGKIGFISNSYIVHDRPQNKMLLSNNFSRRLSINFLKIKNYNSSFCHSVCAFIYRSSVKFVSFLFQIKLKELSLSVKLFWKTIKMLPKIYNSRKESMQGKSFIYIKF